MTEQGNFREWQDEIHPPQPGDWMMGDREPERVEIVADGPDAEPLSVWYEEFLVEFESIKRQMMN
jgi:hypothetical protein